MSLSMWVLKSPRSPRSCFPGPFTGTPKRVLLFRAQAQTTVTTYFPTQRTREATLLNSSILVESCGAFSKSKPALHFSPGASPAKKGVKPSQEDCFQNPNYALRWAPLGISQPPSQVKVPSPPESQHSMLQHPVSATEDWTAKAPIFDC